MQSLLSKWTMFDALKITCYWNIVVLANSTFPSKYIIKIFPINSNNNEQHCKKLSNWVHHTSRGSANQCLSGWALNQSTSARTKVCSRNRTAKAQLRLFVQPWPENTHRNDKSHHHGIWGCLYQIMSQYQNRSNQIWQILQGSWQVHLRWLG